MEGERDNKGTEWKRTEREESSAKNQPAKQGQATSAFSVLRIRLLALAEPAPLLSHEEEHGRRADDVYGN